MNGMHASPPLGRHRPADAGSAGGDLSRAAAWTGLLLVLVAAGVLRWLAANADGLWMDEVFGASYVNLKPWEIVVAVMRFDIHPPGYYLQLDLWSLGGRGDAWLRLNTLAWSLGCIAAVYAGTAARAGRLAGLGAAAMTALLGSELFFAAELRMYAMLSCVVVLLWWCVDAWLLRGQRRALWGVAALMFVLSLLHSVAFLAAGSVLAYAWMTWWLAGAPRPSWKPLAGLTLWTGVLLLPWLANAFMRSVSHTAVPGPDVIASTLGGWWLGHFPGLGGWPLAVGAVFTLGTLLLLLVRATPAVRALTLAFVLGPIVLVAAVSLLLRPIWLDRTMAYAAVFLPIALALHLRTRVGDPRQRRLWLAALIALQAGAFFGPGAGLERLQASRKMQFREAAHHIAEVNTQKRAVYMPSNIRFWGMARYLAGPAWGSMLAVQDPHRADDSDTWQRIYARLGDDLLTRLHLKPRTRVVESANGPLWIGATPLPTEVAQTGYFYVGDMLDREKAQPCPVGNEISRKAFVGVMVFECRQP